MARAKWTGDWAANKMGGVVIGVNIINGVALLYGVILL